MNTFPAKPKKCFCGGDTISFKSEEDNVYMPCQDKLRLLPEDEISVDSIISDLLARVEPNESEFPKGGWDIDAKVLLNEKQALIFKEYMIISKLKNCNCKLTETRKIFREEELERIGDFCLNVEESYDGYVLYSKCQMRDCKEVQKSGFILKAKYDDKFNVICENRTEFDYVDGAKIIKRLKVRNREDEITAVKETTLNDEHKRFRATVNMKGRDNMFLLDGGVMLFIRNLVINHKRGEFEYYSMNLFGKILRCVIHIPTERTNIRLFHRVFHHTIKVTNTQYFNDVPQVESETFLNADGQMIIHFWHGFNYMLHCIRAPVPPKEQIIPKLQLKWKADDVLMKVYKNEQKLSYDNAMEYLHEHPEFTDLLHDFIISLLKYKPDKVLPFAIKFFQNMKRNF